MSENRASGTESGRRILNVLLSFTAQRPLWTVRELADQHQLSQAMAYRYIALLREFGLVDQVSSGTYRVADSIVGLAEAAEAARPPLAELARPVLTQLRDACNETVLVARRSSWNVYTVERVESRQPVRLQFDRGQPMALHRGAMSRILLAALSQRAQREYVETLDPEIRSDPQIQPEALSEVHRAGVTESFGEVDEGIWGVAAAVTLNAEVVASIGCAAPIYRTEADRRKSIRHHVVVAARELSEALARR